MFFNPPGSGISICKFALAALSVIVPYGIIIVTAVVIIVIVIVVTVVIIVVIIVIVVTVVIVLTYILRHDQTKDEIKQKSRTETTNCYCPNDPYKC